MSRVRPLAAAVAVAAYAWWATGLRPFHAAAYVAVGVAGVVVVAVAVTRSRLRSDARGDDLGPTRRAATTVAPWAALAVAVIALEAVGLGLGGRSSIVPTLSTTVDHLLATHAARWIIFLAWVVAGISPALRRARLPRGG